MKTTSLIRRAPAVVVALLLVAGLAGPASAKTPVIAPPGGLAAHVSTSGVDLSWLPETYPVGTQTQSISITKNGTALATLPGAATGYHDSDVHQGGSYTYAVVASATRGTTTYSSAPSTVTVTLPDYLVGAATEDISPPPGVTINQGGNGLGDGSLFPGVVVSRGSQNQFQGEHIRARAMVVDDGNQAIAIADIETQGMFAAYEAGPWGLSDMRDRVAQDIPGLPASHILIASDHTHAGPDTIGAWGGVGDVQIPGYTGDNQYYRYIFDQTVKAIEEAYRSRTHASIRAGESDASDLIYNQSCSEALNQSKTEAYPGPDLCATPGKDGMVRVLQATAPDGSVVVTYMAFAAHGTAGGGPGVHGDWPQFLSDKMAETYGGVGLAMEGAVGGTQPCRPACSFTNPNNPGYNVSDRRTAFTLNYMAHVADALDGPSTIDVHGPVKAAASYIREPVVGPAVTALFMAGQYAGARLLRSHESPWIVGQTIRTVTSALRVGSVLFSGTPGEGFYAIGKGVRDAVGTTDPSDGTKARFVIQLGLADDQLGYLIAPVSYVPIIAGEVAVNDNIIFNVSPTIGDHVMCSDISLAIKLGF
ncbi:MAG: hypothetical protein QOC87_790, partial [Actinomycetota bacterium]|nr:hypothetical protein [Actinomycetota bacterium]